MSISHTFATEAGVSPQQAVRKGESITYAIDYSADFDGGLFLEYSESGGATWHTVRELAVGFKTDVLTTLLGDRPAGQYRFRCITDPVAVGVLTGTAAVTIAVQSKTLQEAKNQAGATVVAVKEDGIEVTGALVRTAQKRVFNAGVLAKSGTSSGWTVAAVDSVCLATLAASLSAKALVIPITGLKVGDTITAFHLIGQIESAGGTVTVDADLRKHTAAAADVADASVGAITQLSAVADTIISSANAGKTGLSEVVGADETFYILVTGTTAGSTDIALQGAAVVVTES